MKQLNKIQSAFFLLGGVLMVVGACSFVLKQIYPSLVETTSWVFLLGTVLLQRDPVDADLRGQVDCDPSLEAHPECSQHPLYLCRHLDGGYGLYLYREMAGQSAALYSIFYGKWIVVMLVASILELYTTFRISHEMKGKNANKT